MRAIFVILRKGEVPNDFFIITENVQSSLIYNFCLRKFSIEVIVEEMGELKSKRMNPRRMEERKNRYRRKIQTLECSE